MSSPWTWQSSAYLESTVVGPVVTRAAIVGLEGGVWATSAGYTLPVDEQTALIALVNNLQTAPQVGLHLRNQKFLVWQTTDRSIYGTKRADGAVVVGVVVVRTSKAILVAEYDAPIQGPQAIAVVEGLADKLVAQGY